LNKMANKYFMSIIFLGLACICIPLVVVGLTYMQPGSSWEDVGQMVALPVLAIFVLGTAFVFLADYVWR